MRGNDDVTTILGSATVSGKKMTRQRGCHTDSAVTDDSVQEVDAGQTKTAFPRDHGRRRPRTKTVGAQVVVVAAYYRQNYRECSRFNSVASVWERINIPVKSSVNVARMMADVDNIEMPLPPHETTLNIYQ
jgi:hypothetical protein